SRPVLDVLPDFADLVDAAIAGGVDFEYIHVFAGGDATADLAGIARSYRWAMDAVKGFGEDPGGGSFAYATRSGEEIGMGNPLGRNRVGERPDHWLLAHQVGELLRTVAPRENRVILWSD